MSRALDSAARLQEMGIEVRSVELTEEAKTLRAFGERGGNREMRRAAKRAGQRRNDGRGKG